MFIQRYHKVRTLYRRQKKNTKESNKIAIPTTIPNQSNHNSYSYIVRRKKEQYSEKDIKKQYQTNSPTPRTNQQKTQENQEETRIKKEEDHILDLLTPPLLLRPPQ